MQILTESAYRDQGEPGGPIDELPEAGAVLSLIIRIAELLSRKAA